MIQSVNIQLKDVDWNLLREQKKILIELTSNPSLRNRHLEGIEGLLNFIDHIQDQAHERCGLPPEEIYIQDDDPWHDEYAPWEKGADETPQTGQI